MKSAVRRESGGGARRSSQGDGVSSATWEALGAEGVTWAHLPKSAAIGLAQLLDRGLCVDFAYMDDGYRFGETKANCCS